jgi:REP element-mobilizing transposase RayT
MKGLPKRKPNRLHGYDYSQNGAYFVTICTKDRAEILGEIVGDDGNRPACIQLSEYGIIADNEIKNIPIIRKEIQIDCYVIMPNHIHLIALIVGDDCHLSANQRADCHPPLRKSIVNGGDCCHRPTNQWADCHLPANQRADCHRPANQQADCHCPANQQADCHPPLRKSIPNMVQGFKGAVTRRIGFGIWQRSYHDHIIRNGQEYMRIAKYIQNNPVKWESDSFHSKKGT